MKSTALLFLALIAAGSAHARPEITRYVDALNDCVSNPHASLAECARMASLRTGSTMPSVYGELDLATGAATGSDNGKFSVCTGGTYNYCDWYECKEDHANQMSICTFVNSDCTMNGKPCSPDPE